jgi:hypothetical protein
MAAAVTHFVALHRSECIICDPTMNRLASILPAAQVLVSVDATSKKARF